MAMYDHAKALVVGGNSFVGQNLAVALEKQKYSVWLTTRRHDRLGKQVIFVDLAQEQWEWNLPAKFDVAFLCASVTSMQQCEDNPDTTGRINVISIVALGKRLVEQGTFVIFLSSNTVFDGDAPLAAPGDPINPQTAYGRKKAETEKQLLALGGKVAILRLGKIVDPQAPLFQGWIKDLGEGKPIHPFHDMVFAPVSLAAVTKMLLMIAREQNEGILHLTGPEDIFYSQAAFWLADKIGAPLNLVRPVAGKAVTKLPHVPRHAALATQQEHLRFGPMGYDALYSIIKEA